MLRDCEMCGVPISKERLEIVPNTRLCVACKKGFEPKEDEVAGYDEIPPDELEKYIKTLTTKAEDKRVERDANIREVIIKKLKHAKNDTRPNLCFECGKPMSLRRRHKDGMPFYGCTEFPSCRGSKDI